MFKTYLRAYPSKKAEFGCRVVSLPLRIFDKDSELLELCEAQMIILVSVSLLKDCLRLRCELWADHIGWRSHGENFVHIQSAILVCVPALKDVLEVLGFAIILIICRNEDRLGIHPQAATERFVILVVAPLARVETRIRNRKAIEHDGIHLPAADATSTSRNIVFGLDEQDVHSGWWRGRRGWWRGW